MQKIRVGVVLLSIVTVVGCAEPPVATPPPPQADGEIYGTYVACSVTCREIRLHEDRTFEMWQRGGEHHTASSRGTWRFIQEDQILMNSQAQPRVEARRIGHEGEIRLRVRDGEGQPLESASGQINCAGTLHYWQIREGELQDRHHQKDAAPSEPVLRWGVDSTIRAMGCRPELLLVRHGSHLGLEYLPEDPAADDFTFLLDRSVDFYVTDERYLWREGALYAWDDGEPGTEGGWVMDFPYAASVAAPG